MLKTQGKPLFYGHKILLLSALEFVLAFSGLGYLIPYGSATIMYVPVIAAAYIILQRTLSGINNFLKFLFKMKIFMFFFEKIYYKY